MMPRWFPDSEGRDIANRAEHQAAPARIDRPRLSEEAIYDLVLDLFAQGTKQNRIPKVVQRLGGCITAVDVTRLLQKAQRDGAYRIVLNISKERTQSARALSTEATCCELVGKLSRLPGSRLSKVRVFNSGTRENERKPLAAPKNEPWLRNVDIFSGNCGEDFATLLSSAYTIVVGYGRSCSSFVEAISSAIARGAVPPPDPTVLVVPSAGQPVSRQAVRPGFDATSVAARLASGLGSGRSLSLANISYWDEASRAQTVEDSDYKKVCEAWYGADALLTSVGALSTHPHLHETELELRGLNWSEANRLLAGNIAGVWLPKQGVTWEDKTPWPAIGLPHLRAIAARANPGVIVGAIGQNKALPALRAIQMGLLSVLLCDWSLLHAIEAMLAQGADA